MCEAKTKAGERCPLPAKKDGLCGLHLNQLELKLVRERDLQRNKETRERAERERRGGGS